jgi:HPt (histidine-containing phosphotransfer) domain-containing protein
MANDTQRMQEIQNALVAHIQTQLTTDEDFMYVATMLLKHSMVLYKTFLDDEQIQKMLVHVAETISDDLDINDYAISNNDGGTTRH